jgi:putative DNA methylase
MDAVITDPPYYDNISYSDLSDFFYVWLKRAVGWLYPEHFAAVHTPKKSEAIAHKGRADGDNAKARTRYEALMAQAFTRAHAVMKPGAPMVVVYAHKTTLGWATLVDALRRARFTITEAWPLDTELGSGMVKKGMAMLASSVFLAARKRTESVQSGNYEDGVQPELQQIVRERVDTLWEMGIAGADLVIACVGAGLGAFTKYEKVEYANGEEVPAEKFLAEVEAAVLDRMMEKLFGQSGGKVSAIDPASRFYVLWRFVYKASEIDAGEAIVFTYAQHVELDGPLGLSSGKDALVEKKKAKYRARDFTERGENDKLGLPEEDGKPASLIDVLHRVLWLMEHSPRKLREFLLEAGADRERLRVLAQALSGAALSGKSEEDAEKLIGTTAAEKAALGKLLANWRSVIENVAETREEREDRQRGQKKLF